MTNHPSPNDPCPICDRPRVDHNVLDTLRCIEAMRRRNQAARVVEFERLHPREEASHNESIL
jgi:hypothetical protein